MPMPKPNEIESHDEFIERCMGDTVMVEEYDDSDQRYAICESLWKEKKAMNENVETRVFPASELRVIKQGDGPPTFEGYAAVFNKLSEDLGGFREKIRPKAFANAIKNSDTRALFNHDSNYVLGRTTAGTLDLKEDRNGLKFSVVPPDTSWARDLMVSVQRGDISQCSFGFTLAKNGDEWHEKDGEMTRTIREVNRLMDVSLVSFPAYPDTSVALRSMETAKTVEPPDKRVVIESMVEVFLSEDEITDEHRKQFIPIIDEMIERFGEPTQAENAQEEVGEIRGDEQNDSEPMQATFDKYELKEFFTKKENV